MNMQDMKTKQYILQNLPVKKFEKRSILGRVIQKVEGGRFYWDTVQSNLGNATSRHACCDVILHDMSLQTVVSEQCKERARSVIVAEGLS